MPVHLPSERGLTDRYSNGASMHPLTEEFQLGKGAVRDLVEGAGGGAQATPTDLDRAESLHRGGCHANESG